MIKRLGQYLIQQTYVTWFVALLCALLSLYLPGFSLLTLILVALITMCQGAESGLKLLSWVALPAIAQLVLSEVSIADTLFLQAICIWVMACLLQRFQLMASFKAMGLLFVLLVVVAHIWLGDMTAWWVHKLTITIQQFGSSDLMNELKSYDGHMIQQLAALATSSMVLTNSLFLVFCLLLSRAWQLTLTSVCRPSLLSFMREIQLDKAAFIMFICAMACLCAYQVSLLRDMVVALMLPSSYAGWALVHVYLTEKRLVVGFWGRLRVGALLFLFYMAMILFPMGVFLMVALLACFSYLEGLFKRQQPCHKN